jgi:hypothetical protein
MNHKTLIAIDPDALHAIEQKLDQLLSGREKLKENQELEWLTNKQFKESVSIKAYNTFVKIRDKMPESLKREINGKHYINREAIKKYFLGEFSS